MADKFGDWAPEDITDDLIHGFVNNHEPEDASLQIKGVDHLAQFTVQREQKKELRRMLADYATAFANSNGGLLVLGIDHRPDGQLEQDVAGGWSCVTNSVDLSPKRILELLKDTADLPFSDEFMGAIYSRTFTCPDDSSKHGCWVLIPKSLDAPHQRTDGKRAGQYLYPTQQGLERMRHSDLVTRIRGKRPRLTIEDIRAIRASPEVCEPSLSKVTLKFEIHVRNSGPGTARDLVLYARTAELSPECRQRVQFWTVATTDWKPDFPEPGATGWRGTEEPILHEDQATVFRHSLEINWHGPIPGILEYVAAYHAAADDCRSETALLDCRSRLAWRDGVPVWDDPRREITMAGAGDDLSDQLQFYCGPIYPGWKP